MSEVIDLNARRMEKAVQEGDGTTEVVRLIACMRCSSSEFRLAWDGRVVCAGCCCEVSGCRWFDQNKPEPPAA